MGLLGFGLDKQPHLTKLKTDLLGLLGFELDKQPHLTKPKTDLLGLLGLGVYINTKFFLLLIIRIQQITEQ